MTRLYFLKPLLRLSIAFVWLISGISAAFLLPKESVYPLLSYVGITPNWQPFTLYGASTLDILLGLATLMNYRLKMIGALQCILIIIYTLIISWKFPELWIEPFAPIAKNIPLLAAILVMISLESDR